MSPPRGVYEGVLGGKVVMDAGPTVIKLSNTWIIINPGGGPTDDKPDVVLDVPPDPNLVSAFLNLRVADIRQVYEEWSAKGATFLTPPIDRSPEIRSGTTIRHFGLFVRRPPSEAGFHHRYRG